MKSFFSGFGFFSLFPASEIAKPKFRLMASQALLTPSNFDSAVVHEAVNQTLRKIQFNLPNGDKIFPGNLLTDTNDCDTIWTSGSTG